MAKKALILGFGISGKSVATFLQKEGIDFVAVDKKASEMISDLPLLDEKEVTSLKGFDFIVKSPGIANNHPLVLKANDEKIPLTSEMELACLELKKKKGKRVFGITGSNGKTTTTLLTSHILNTSKKKALACGNVGLSLLSQVDENVDFFIVELSSYQLETLRIPLFELGFILNITPNHLDRYESLVAYAQAKSNLKECLKENGTLLVGKRAFEEFNDLFPEAKPLFLLDIKEKIETISPLKYRDGEFLWIKSHDIENISAAYRVVQEVGLSEEEFWTGLATFKKPPHRLEFVRKMGEVEYINDSKATSVDAVIKALDSIESKVILIAGGLDKGGDYRSWIPYFKKKVKKVLLIGQAAEKIENDLEGTVEIEKVENINNAVKMASKSALPGECVLFSPGCASFDQFFDYQKRGETFKQLIMELSYE